MLRKTVELLVQTPSFNTPFTKNISLNVATERQDVQDSWVSINGFRASGKGLRV